MGGTTDKVTGDVKRKGEQLADAAKDAADRASEKVDDGVDRVRGRD